jgi:hypothetical protein
MKSDCEYVLGILVNADALRKICVSFHFRVGKRSDSKLPGKSKKGTQEDHPDWTSLAFGFLFGCQMVSANILHVDNPFRTGWV